MNNSPLVLDAYYDPINGVWRVPDGCMYHNSDFNDWKIREDVLMRMRLGLWPALLDSKAFYIHTTAT